MNLIQDALKKLNKIEDDFTISNIILFDDVSKIDVYNGGFSDGQYEEINEDEKINKYTMTKDEVSKIIHKLKKCNTINQNDYYKTYKFLRNNSLSLKDCLEIIHSLSVKDYYASTKSTNPDHIENTLIIFEPYVTKLSDGREFNDLIVYIKIDVDDTTDDAVALVSIHNGSRGKLPYGD